MLNFILGHNIHMLMLGLCFGHFFILTAKQLTAAIWQSCVVL
jgi:hypothetical protein